MKIRYIIVILVCSTIAVAQTRLPSFFSNNMVLQQNEKVAIWGIDDSNTKISVSGSWGSKSRVTSDEDGKWKLTLQTPVAGGPYNLTIKGSDKIILSNVLIGEVWLCSGQSNMQMPVKGNNNQPINGSNESILNSKNSQIRLFKTKLDTSLQPLNDVTGQWLEADPLSVGNFSAAAYYFGRKLEAILDVPVGLIQTAWGGSPIEAWMDKESLSEFKTITIPDKIPKKQPQKVPTVLHNAMLNPFIGYTMGGVIWYQGESNQKKAGEYKVLFPLLIKSWRELWQQGDFPFYFVQIAPFNYKDGNSAFLREAQLHTMQTVVNTGMAVTMDIGECDCIHPSEKELIGDRLAYWALSETYGIKEITYSGPVYKEMEKLPDGKIQLKFSYIPNGFSSFGQELTGFEIAGEDRVFYPAQAKINKNKTITVMSEQIANPVAVRYVFNNCAKGTLFNVGGLPATSFRTDNWNE